MDPPRRKSDPGIREPLPPEEGLGDWAKFASFRGIVRLFLCVAWDPIGVFGAPQALDEYDRYVVPIARLIEGGASREELAAHLEKIEREQMGLRPGPELQAVAERLLWAHRRYMQFGRKTQ